MIPYLLRILSNTLRTVWALFFTRTRAGTIRYPELRGEINATREKRGVLRQGCKIARNGAVGSRILAWSARREQLRPYQAMMHRVLTRPGYTASYLPLPKGAGKSGYPGVNEYATRTASP